MKNARRSKIENAEVFIFYSSKAVKNTCQVGTGKSRQNVFTFNSSSLFDFDKMFDIQWFKTRGSVQNDVTKPCFLTTTATTTSWVLWLPFRKRIKAIDIIQTMLRIEMICLNRVSANDVTKLDIVRIQLEFVKLAQKKELQVYNVFFPWTYC